MTEAINVTARIKGSERYIVLWHDDQRPDVLRTLGRWAANTELSFSWYDAALVSLRIRQVEVRQ